MAFWHPYLSCPSHPSTLLPCLSPHHLPRHYAENNFYHVFCYLQHYEKADEARAAADALNGTEYNGNTLKVEVNVLIFLSYDYQTDTCTFTLTFEQAQRCAGQKSLGLFQLSDRELQRERERRGEKDVISIVINHLLYPAAIFFAVGVSWWQVRAWEGNSVWNNDIKS